MDMAAQSSLQGSLFNEQEQSFSNSKATKDFSSDSNQELSDAQLTEDSKQRPRMRREKENEDNFNLIKSQNHDQTKKNKDIPAWSHHNLVNIDQLTPVLRHYVELKIEHPERILLYRLGDFFECFFEDAIKLSQLLELTLTGKEGGKSIGRVPMAGIPHHAAERYCAELIQKGLSISICDQLETTPSKSGVLLKRGITRVITPGTIIEEGMLQSRKNNWLGAVVIEKDLKNLFKWGLARADVSTGEFLVREGEGSNALRQELLKLEASEVIYGRIQLNDDKDWCPKFLHLTDVPSTPFNRLEAESSLKTHFKLSTIKGLGLKETPLAIRAAGGLIAYIKETKPYLKEIESDTNSSQITLEFPQLLISDNFLIIDAQTHRNLEITTTQRDGQFQGSLLWAIDRTLTAMGGRCLRKWLEAPLIDVELILERQEIVSHLVNYDSQRNSIRRLLRAMGDLERLAGRAGAGHASCRDLAAIADGLERLPQLASFLANLPKKLPTWIDDIKKVNPELNKLANKIKQYLINNPPLSLTEGGLIHDGVDPVLDGLRNQIDDQNDWLKSQENHERKVSGINNLRLQYHRTFGYFLSVNKSKAKSVPKHWIRRQTLSNEERFITPELKAREGKIFQIKARAAQREYEIFCNLRILVGKQAREIRKSARAIAGIDALSGLAEIASTNSYTPPKLINNNYSKEISIKDCRHPVVEQLLVEKKFKENDIYLGKDLDLLILTGPNASGKSCYLRQIGLMQILSQIGSWIPAKEATLSIADRVFTRVGAVDDLAAGESTFVVEMTETAFILNQATNKSLVLLDEIGRGTSTFDGLSIAWSVSEYLAKVIKSRTIFATHYHELNELSDNLNNVGNLQVLVKETGDELCFLHQVVPGGANRSYGIEAARLAGVPKDVIKRAKLILQDLEKKS